VFVFHLHGYQLSGFCLLSPTVAYPPLKRDSFQARVGLLLEERNVESSSVDCTLTVAGGVRSLDDQVGVIGPEEWLLTSRRASIRWGRPKYFPNFPQSVRYFTPNSVVQDLPRNNDRYTALKQHKCHYGLHESRPFDPIMKHLNSTHNFRAKTKKT
jgi:hypothetical protein